MPSLFLRVKGIIMPITDFITPTYGGMAFGGVLVVMSLLQISKIEINPWSWVAKKVGNAINHDISEQIKGVEERANERMNKFETAIEELSKTQEIDREASSQYRAIASRVRILMFNEELLQNTKHSKEMFDQVLYDITMYTHYCDAHPNFENDKAVMAIQNVRRCYKQCLEQNDFI